MRTFTALVLASTMACVLTGCEKPAPNPPQSSRPGSKAAIGSAPRTSPIDDLAQNTIAPAEALDLSEDSSTDALELVTGKVDTTVTLGAWMKSHPRDKITDVPPVAGIDDPFCRAAVAQTHLMGRALARYAMFYIPPLSKAEKLPSDTATAAGEYCELRTIVLVSEETDVPHGQALADSLALLVSTRIGSWQKDVPLGAGGVRTRKGAKMWNGPGTKVIVATGVVDKKRDSATHTTGEEGADTVVADTVKREVARTYAVAYAPGSGAQDFNTWESRYDAAAGQRIADQQQKYSDIDSALTWAAVPSLTADLGTVLTFLKQHDPENISQVRPAPVDVALARAMKTIHDVAPTLPPARRAAALLAGEVTLFASLALQSADSNMKINHTLDSLGISFAQGRGENGVKNTHAWLWQAWEQDSTGRAGRAAFVRLLALWWPNTGECNTEEYARMIQQGEAELKRGDTNPAIYFYVGSAYKSLYDFAHFENDEYEATASVKAQAESARLKGIEYFRLAVRSLPEGEMRRDAWAKGMRLMMRRTGDQPEYVCLPD